MIRVFVTDDHAIITDGLAKIIEAEEDMTVVGTATNSEDVYTFFASNKCDILILDISMPGKTGLEVLHDMVKDYPKIKVLIYSMHPTERYAMRSLRIGAFGYITKNSPVTEIIRAIRTAYAGNKYLPEDVANKLIFGIDADNDAPEKILSNREFQVFLKLSAGKTVTEASDELSLSHSTINTYRTRILEKMGLHSNAEMIYYAIQNNLVE